LSDRIERLRQSIEEALQPELLQITDESSGHARGGVHTHLRVLVVSAAFESQTRVARHRVLNDLAASELRSGLHAFAVEALTPSQWQAQNERAAAQSPPCASTPAGSAD
jgi:BolA protein